MRKFKHLPTGDIVIQYLTGNYQNEAGGFIAAYYVENGKDWQEIIDSYPIGTKVKELATGQIWEKKETAPMWVSESGETTMAGIENRIGEEFELVQEKGWEITCWRDKNNIYSHSLRQATPDFEIYSVKRLSDSATFKIGDKIKTGLTDNSIEFFKIVNTEIVAFGKNFSVGYRALEKKEKLFTTEDGVNYYGEGIQLWYIREWKAIEIHAPNYWNVERICSTKKQAEEIGSKFIPSYKWFSTKEKAQEYILMNKPCISINDLFTGRPSENLQINLNVLKEIVKSKING